MWDCSPSMQRSATVSIHDLKCCGSLDLELFIISGVSVWRSTSSRSSQRDPLRMTFSFVRNCLVFTKRARADNADYKALILQFCTMVAYLYVIWDCYDCSIIIWLIDWSGSLSIALCIIRSTVVHKKVCWMFWFASILLFQSFDGS